MSKLDHRHQALLDGTAGCTHGLASTYDVYGCRCEACTAAQARRVINSRLTRSLRLQADPTLAKHGLRSTYTNWQCRCEACSIAHAESCKTQYNKRKAKAEVE